MQLALNESDFGGFVNIRRHCLQKMLISCVTAPPHPPTQHHHILAVKEVV